MIVDGTLWSRRFILLKVFNAGGTIIFYSNYQRNPRYLTVTQEKGYLRVPRVAPLAVNVLMPLLQIAPTVVYQGNPSLRDKSSWANFSK